MAKRSNFERRDRDFYKTPKSAVVPLIPHLPKMLFFDEPFAGDGQLANALLSFGYYYNILSDIEPQESSAYIIKCDAMDVTECRGDMFISNCPWPAPGSQGEPVIAFIKHLTQFAPVWLLLSADFAHNKYFAKVQPICVKIVSVGRVSWMENGVGSKDNASWYLFDKDHNGFTEFVGRSDASPIEQSEQCDCENGYEGMYTCTKCNGTGKKSVSTEQGDDNAES